MSYKALYRVFRPKTFSDVVGQKHIITVLKNQVISGQISHAYLFTGSRGTGKTSVAKIFARSISCPNSKDGEACLVCDLCKDTFDDNSIDIVEIDAASNNGVDEIRELRENVKYAPAKGKYKVYIIDEVHMLSSGAFNALLKTLEEPPLHVVFILATTEPQKLPDTIISRCQRYDFEKIEIQDITKRLKEICNEVSAKADDSALNLIAKYANGGLRDAISLLDQCIVFGENNVTADNVLELLGKSSSDTLFDIAQMLIDGDGYRCIETVNKQCADGKNISILTGEIIDHLRSLMIFKISNNPTEIINTKNPEKFIEQSKKANSNMLIRAVKLFSEALMNMKYSFNPIVVFEIAVMDIVTPQISDDKFALLERIEKIEKTIETGKNQQDRVNKRPVIKQEAQSDEDAVPWEEEKTQSDEDLPPWEEEKTQSEDDAAPWEEETPKANKQPFTDSLKEAADRDDDKTGDSFGEKEYKKLLQILNKEQKGVYISLKNSFFGGQNDNKIYICYPDESCSVFMKAVEAKKDVIIGVLEKMGFNHMDICVKISDVDSTQAVIDMFGKDKVKIID